MRSSQRKHGYEWTGCAAGTTRGVMGLAASSPTKPSERNASANVSTGGGAMALRGSPSYANMEGKREHNRVNACPRVTRDYFVASVCTMQAKYSVTKCTRLSPRSRSPAPGNCRQVQSGDDGGGIRVMVSSPALGDACIRELCAHFLYTYLCAYV